MSGPKDRSGERPRRYVTSNNGANGRRLSQANLREIRRAIDVANARARRAGKIPKKAQIIMFSCACNCFCVCVE